MVKRILKRVYDRLPLKLQLFHVLRPLGLPESVYRHLRFTGPFRVPIDDHRGFMIEHLGAIVENELFWSGFGGDWEGLSSRIWARICDRQSGIIVDVGANTGVYSLIAATVADRSATIVAFEPLSRVAEILRRNAALNTGNIEIKELALSDHDGTAVIPDFDRGWGGGRSQ